MRDRRFQYLVLPEDKSLNPALITVAADALGEKQVLIDHEASPSGYAQAYPFDIYQAYHLRLISFFNGAIYILNHDPDLSAEQKQYRYTEIQSLAQLKLQRLDQFKANTAGKAVQFGGELYLFYQEELPKTLGFSADDIALGEAFYVWQELERPTRITRYQRPLEQGSLLIEQVNIPRNAVLTLTQKQELLKIHEINKQPQWFLDLAPFAKASLLELVPTRLENDWSAYQKGLPAVLKAIPGESNASQHNLKITFLGADGRERKILENLSHRQGVPSSYAMSNRYEREQSAQQNLAQALDHQALLDESKKEFQESWGLSPEQDIRFPILFLGLVTPRHQAGYLSSMLDRLGASGDENNTRFAHEKDLAILHYFQQHPEAKQGAEIFNLNAALNSNLSIVIEPDRNYCRFLANLLNQLDILVAEQQALGVEEPSILEERVLRLKLLHSAERRLNELFGQGTIEGRNRNAYLASLYLLSQRLLKGFSLGNCKSAKDRLVINLMLSDALQIYCLEQMLRGEEPVLPAYNEPGAKRAVYLDIFAKHFASGHQLLTGHDNSPGAPGIKDEGVLDTDMIQALQSMRKEALGPGQAISKKDPLGLYAQSKQVAEFNKPGSFWMKYGPRIQNYLLAFAIILTALICSSLMLSGILSPVCLVGSGLVSYLGTAGLILGGAVNVTFFSLLAGMTVTLGGLIGDRLEANRNLTMSFSAQEDRLEREPPAVNPRSSTSRMPFLASHPDYSKAADIELSFADLSEESPASDPLHQPFLEEQFPSFLNPHL